VSISDVKVILFANTEWYLYNFRLSLAHALRERGAEVVLISPAGPYGARLAAKGFRWIALPMERRSLNPLREARLLLHLIRLYRRERPDVVHNFTIKCVVYGSLAARAAGIEQRINAVAGMGHVFTRNDLATRLLRPFVSRFLKIALSGERARLILQNTDDFAALEQSRLIDADRVRLIRGSGVNTIRFYPHDKSGAERKTFRVLLAARLLWDKGIREYVEAARQLKNAGLDIEFLLAGAPDSGNPAAVPENAVRAWNDAGFVSALGHVEDMAVLLHQVDAVVLPSYYGEGVPKSLIEAAACGLPIITTDAPGCREIVEHGVNGLLVPCRDPVALAGAIRFVYEQPSERVRMGTAARAKVLEHFDENIVLAKTLDVYRELVPGGLPAEHR
jgi:glycosyltransferase involved in cell wall biosynthesis